METAKENNGKEKIEKEVQKDKKEKVKIYIPLYLTNNEGKESSIKFINDKRDESYNKYLKIGNKEYQLIIFGIEILEDKISKQYEIQYESNGNNYKIIIEKKNKLIFAFKVKLEKRNIYNYLTIINQELGYKNTYIAFNEFIEKYDKKQKYEKLLIDEGINIFKEVKAFDLIIIPLL